MTTLVNINATANLFIFNDKVVYLIAMHISNNRPKQFEDNYGNLWYDSELTNFIHIR